MDQKTVETYNQLAQAYDAETSDFWDRFPRDFFDKFASEVSRGKVLDVGSGPGRDGLLLKEKGLDVVCIDASSSMVEISSARGLTSVVGDFLNLPFQDEEFDGAWAYTSLLHVPKKEVVQALKEIRRVLKPNAAFGLGLIEGNTESYRKSSGVNQLRWFSYYEKSEIEHVLKEQGFELFYFNSFQPGSKNYLHFLSKKIARA